MLILKELNGKTLLEIFGLVLNLYQKDKKGTKKGGTGKKGTEKGGTEKGETEKGETEKGGTGKGRTGKGGAGKGGTEKGETEKGGTGKGGTGKGGTGKGGEGGEGKGKGRKKRQEDPKPGTSGTGLKILPSDPNALIERFDLLFSSKKARHTGVRNEIVSILDELKRQGVININEYKKLNSLIKK